jgi:hypothetical protein
MGRPRRHSGACGAVAAALLGRNGEVALDGAPGIADRNHGVSMRLDSKLNLG